MQAATPAFKGGSDMNIYEDPSVLNENRVKERAYFIPFHSAESAVEGKKECSRLCKLLNGEWDFL